jgi:hypothetical protein
LASRVFSISASSVRSTTTGADEENVTNCKDTGHHWVLGIDELSEDQKVTVERWIQRFLSSPSTSPNNSREARDAIMSADGSFGNH